MSEPVEDTLTEKANAAFRQAAARVIERARQTGTQVLTWEEGRVVERAAQEKEIEPQETPIGPKRTRPETQTEES